MEKEKQLISISHQELLKGLNLQLRVHLRGRKLFGEHIWLLGFFFFFYDICIPTNAVNSFYFKPMVNVIATIGPSYKGPTYYQLRVNLLKDVKKEVQSLEDSYLGAWEKVGCIIMNDGWPDNRHKTLINFMVYCPQGILFVKFVDTSDIVTDANKLFLLFDEIIIWVGPTNLVQMVIDNATNFVAVGRLIFHKYKHINWLTCAPHCLNLIFKDICKLNHIAELARHASKVTIFVYNHIKLVRKNKRIDKDSLNRCNSLCYYTLQ